MHRLPRSLFGATARTTCRPRSLRNVQHIRYSSSGPQQATRSGIPLAAVVAGVLVSGGIGFAVAKGWSTDSSDELLRLSSIPANSNSGLNEQYGSAEDFRKAIEELKVTFPGDDDVVSTDSDVLEVHGNSDNDYHPGTYYTITRYYPVRSAHDTHTGSLPSVVIFPKSTEDVVKIVRISRKYKMPIIPYSGATSLEGHYRAVCYILCFRVCHLTGNPTSRRADLFVLICQAWTRYWKFTVWACLICEIVYY